MNSPRKLPRSRIGRMSKLGRLTSGIVGGAMATGVKQLARGQKPSLQEMLLTPSNFQRLSDRLAEMRGAAMKMGQLISMEGGEFIPAELNQLLARLRKDAYSMPLGQVAAVLKHNWGKDWQAQFEFFSFTPLAAASIGQVHEARLKSGEHLAIKIQYPGVRQSIDADVDNVTRLLGMLNLLPAHLDFRALLQDAKAQLHQEADYAGEAAHLQMFAGLLVDDPRFAVPAVHEGLTTSEVLTMQFMQGAPIETLTTREQALRDRVGASLLELSMRELFDWGLVQTDPNFANFQYDAELDRIVLLDFGASRRYPRHRREAFAGLVQSSLVDDPSAMLDAAQAVGYVDTDDPDSYRQGILQLLSTASEPLRVDGIYDFGSSNLSSRMADSTIKLRTAQAHGRLPPSDVLFLHRKLAGLYLLLNRLQSRLDVAQIVTPVLQEMGRVTQP